MSLILDGTNGLSDVDGSAATPAIRGTDANTGIFFPAADTIAFSEGGTEAARFDASGNLGIGTDSPNARLHVFKNAPSDPAIIRAQNGSSGNFSDYAACIVNAVGASGYITAWSNGSARAGSFWLGTDNAIPIVFGNNDTERMRVNAGAPILCLAGGNTSATGTGIAFPATQSASADANTLDDYEEGTWTPTIVSGGGTISGTGRYTKVGRIVQFSIDAQLGGTRNGDVFIVGGLPFVNIDWAACGFYCQQFFPEGTQQAAGFVRSTSTSLTVQTFGADAAGTDFGNGYANWAGTYAAQ